MFHSILLMLAGCGGIPEDTPLTELETEDWVELCADITADLPTESELVDCGLFEEEVAPYTAADCESDTSFLTATCAATVLDWQTCVTGFLASDPCDRQGPEECVLVAECSSI